MAEQSGTKAPALLRVYGAPRSSEAYSIRDFLHRSDVDFEFVPLTTDEEARTQAEVLHLRDSRLPVCVFPDGTRMECPTIRQITEKLGWFVNPSRSEYDLAIYGAGPAGLSAAVYGASDGLKTVVVERGAVGDAQVPVAGGRDHAAPLKLAQGGHEALERHVEVLGNVAGGDLVGDEARIAALDLAHV